MGLKRYLDRMLVAWRRQPAPPPSTPAPAEDSAPPVAQDPMPPEDEGLVPPEALRYRVHGWTDVKSFLRVGEKCRDDLEAALAGIDRPLAGFSRVLDFGCGSGRTLLSFARERPQTVQF